MNLIDFLISFASIGSQTHRTICVVILWQIQFIEANVRRISSDIDNGPLNDLVHEFGMQILHEPFHITANGFFTINLNLLSSVSHTCHDLPIIWLCYAINK